MDSFEAKRPTELSAQQFENLKKIQQIDSLLVLKTTDQDGLPFLMFKTPDNQYVDSSNPSEILNEMGRHKDHFIVLTVNGAYDAWTLKNDQIRIDDSLDVKPLLGVNFKENEQYAIIYDNKRYGIVFESVVPNIESNKLVADFLLQAKNSSEIMDGQIDDGSENELINAREQAKKILDEAQEKAKEIIAQAQETAKKIIEQAGNLEKKTVDNKIKEITDDLGLPEEFKDQKSIEIDLPPEVKKLVDAYNENSKKQDKSQFLQEYKPIMVAVENAMKIGKGIKEDLKFKNASYGDYLMIPNENNGFLVFPRFDLIYQDLYHYNGGMETIFKPDNFDPTLRYKSIRVIEPAIFEKDSYGDYKLSKPGRIELSDSEKNN